MRHSALLLTLVYFTLFIAHVHGHSSGARDESCDSLTVTHAHLGNAVNGAPCAQDPCLSHQLRLIDNSADTFMYNCGQTYQLRLTLDRVAAGNPAESLNGYMVAPREDTGSLGADVAYVGSWVPLNDDQKLLCSNQSVTQARVLLDTVAVDMNWTAPDEGERTVAFWFVVVPSTAFYYLPVRSLVANPNPATCSCSATCENGGTLNTGDCTCNCADGYSGASCDTCARTCQNGGALVGETCKCGGCRGSFSGVSCEVCAISCNGGTRDNRTCTCDCPLRYTGTSCETLLPVTVEIALIVGPVVGGILLIALVIFLVVIIIALAWRYKALCCKPDTKRKPGWEMQQEPAFSGVSLSKSKGDKYKP